MRYTVSAVEDGQRIFGMNTVGIVDEEAGGIIAYSHVDNAFRIISALDLLDKEEGR